MSEFPFTEQSAGAVIRRTFSSRVDSEELAWHRDRETRTVTVVEGQGWYLQHDGALPMKLRAGDAHVIPARTWHRVIKRAGCSDLIVDIIKR